MQRGRTQADKPCREHVNCRDTLPAPEAVAGKLRAATALRPDLAIWLGSGFGYLTSAIELDRRIPYAKLAGFPVPTVPGHTGELLIGRLSGEPVIVLCGRAHYYEGHSMAAVTFPVRVLAAFGIRALLLTNAAGGINRRLVPGDLMLVRDHINLMGVNPLRGYSGFGRPAFVDMTQAYDPRLNALLRRAARLAKVNLRTGVYMAVSGPSYETPAEVRAFARLGADAIGMSTIPEVIVARQCGLRVAAVSCITNLAAGVAKGPLSHDEVLRTGERITHIATALLKAFVRLYAQVK